MIEIGKIYKIKEGHESECGSFNRYKGKFIKITNNEGYLSYEILNKNKKVVSSCSCFSEDDLAIEKTLDNLEVGDILESASGERSVLAICGDVYCLSYIDYYDVVGSWLTKKEIEKLGYKPKQVEETQELTVKEISEKLGIKNLKIIKEK